LCQDTADRTTARAGDGEGGSEYRKRGDGIVAENDARVVLSVTGGDASTGGIGEAAGDGVLESLNGRKCSQFEDLVPSHADARPASGEGKHANHALYRVSSGSLFMTDIAEADRANRAVVGLKGGLHSWQNTS
jgi:hypothetical protein